jgi:creatinine amidohydrolase
MIGPTISVSASGEHADFPGTLSIGSAVTTSVFVELVRSADWAAGVVLVNGHGGNHAAVSEAVAILTAERRRALAWSPKWPQRRDGGPADLHAGRIETSMMLAIDPGLVRLELAERGTDATIADLRARGVRAVSDNGVLGDPEGASGREGERFITAFVADLVHQIERWRPLDPSDTDG